VGEIRCPHCGGDGEVPGMEYVSHDMAIDAGEPELEGQQMEYMYPCPTCGGSGAVQEDD